MAEKKPHMSRGGGADETSTPAANFLSQCDLNHIISRLEYAGQRPFAQKDYEVEAIPTAHDGKTLIRFHARRFSNCVWSSIASVFTRSVGEAARAQFKKSKILDRTRTHNNPRCVRTLRPVW